jgi:hypothetical protein
MTVTSKSLVPTSGATSQLPPTAAKSTRDAGVYAEYALHYIIHI